MKSSPLVAFAALLAALCIGSCGTSTNPQPINPIIGESLTYLTNEDSLVRNDSLLNDLFEDEDRDRHDTHAITATIKPNNGFGIKVSTDTVEKYCLPEYERVMNDHGFPSTPPQPGQRPTLPSDLRLITLMEHFRGKEIIKFLRQAAHLHGLLGTVGGKKKVRVQIAFGIYTKPYLDYLVKTVQVDPADIAGKEGRVGIFLISKAEDPTTKKKILVAPADDPDSFDFGGLKP